MQRRMTRFLGLAEANGVVLRVTRGLATWEEQDALFAQGGVTRARGGYSGHNFGYCADVVPDEPTFPGFQPDWNALHPAWKTILTLALHCGLAEGAQWRSFPDLPHLYLKECPATPTDAMRKTYEVSGMAGVWELIDGLLPKQTNAEDVQQAAAGE